MRRCLRFVPGALLALTACCALVGCDDGPATAAPPDVAPPDAAPPDADAAPDAALDAAPDAARDAAHEAGVDAAPDAAPLDAAPDPDAAPRDPVPARALALDDAVIEGPHARLPEGVLLDPGGALRWTIDDPGPQADAPALHLAVAAVIWRVEDGAFAVEWSTADEAIADAVEVRGDADAPPRLARTPYADWTAPVFGPGARPPALPLPTGPGPWTLTLTATGGGAVVRGAWLLDPLADGRPALLPDPLPTAPPPEPNTVLEPAPCADPGCDDGALITAAIAEAPEGPVTVRLEPTTYTLRSTLRVARDDVRIEGAGPDGFEAATVLFWDPPPGGQEAAVRFAGAGLQNGAAAPVLGDLDGASRFVRVDAPADWAPARVWITADDFGDVPPVCLEGRDVERFSRHIGRHARVLSIAPAPEGEAGLVVELDRGLHLDVPAASNPRLVPSRLIRGGGLFGVHLQANCPEALEISNFTQARCQNPTVIDDNGLFIEWAEGTRAGFVSSRGFGKFAIVVQRALDIRVEDCAMDHPSAYGGGGQGYGVHLIRTGRTVVRRQRVEVARHGVVVDFGSTDAQVLDGRFRTMNQALVDVHGEASYDTLIRGNDMAGSNLGIIVGGGGRETHCNDGPRHHLEDNVIADAIGAGITVSDYTRGVFVRANDVDTSGLLFTAAFGGGDVLIEHNRFGRNTLGFPPVHLLLEDTGGVVVRRNRFDAHCSAADAAGALLGAEPALLEDNVYCPEGAE